MAAHTDLAGDSNSARKCVSESLNRPWLQRRQVVRMFERRYVAGSEVLNAAEMALPVILTAGAGLRSLVRISAVDLGFNADGLVTMEVLPLDRDPGAHKACYTALLQQLRTVPGISSAGLVDNFALGDVTTLSSVSVGGVSTQATVFETMPGYLETMGARLRDGRLPTEADYAGGFRGAVINESAARAFSADGPAVGREFTAKVDPARSLRAE